MIRVLAGAIGLGVLAATFGKPSGRLALEFAFAGAADIRADHEAKQMLGIDAFSMCAGREQC